MLAAGLVLFGVALAAAMLADLNPPVMSLVAFAALIAGEALALVALYDEARARRARRAALAAAEPADGYEPDDDGEPVEALDVGPIRAGVVEARLTVSRPAAYEPRLDLDYPTAAMPATTPSPRPRPRPYLDDTEPAPPVEDVLDGPAPPPLDLPPGRHRAHGA